jgi:ligand-binding SRPBCC domain-containing protein
MELEARVFVNASAIGWYGDRGDEVLDESSAPGTGFLAELCRDWEAAAAPARAARVVYARFGIILGREGGAFPPLARLARLGLLGPLGGGTQWMSWVHIEDAVAALVRIVEEDRFVGPVCVAARPVRQRDFARTLAAAFERSAIVPAPRFALRLALGEASSAVLASQRVVSRSLVASELAFPTIESAIADLATDDVQIARARGAGVRDARYTLSTSIALAAPLADVFPFFASAKNLAMLTPPRLAFEIVGEPHEMANDTVIDYKLRVAGLPVRWRTRIERWAPERQFVDSQERGPYRTWWHEHTFHDRGGVTIMEDVVHYAPPFGPLGAIANRLFIKGTLRRIFNYRRAAMRLRFGIPDERAPTRGYDASAASVSRTPG